MGWPLGGDWDRATTPPGASTADLSMIMEAIALAIGQRQSLVANGVATETSAETSWYYTDAISGAARKRRPVASDFNGVWIHGPCVKRFVEDAQAAIDALCGPHGFFESQEYAWAKALTGNTIGAPSIDKYWIQNDDFPAQNNLHDEIGEWLNVDVAGVLDAPLWLQMKAGLNLLRYMVTREGFEVAATPERKTYSGGATKPDTVDEACAAYNTYTGALEDALAATSITEDTVPGQGNQIYYWNRVFPHFCDGDVEWESGDISHTAYIGAVAFERGEIPYEDWRETHPPYAPGTFGEMLIAVRSYAPDNAASKNQLLPLTLCGTHDFTPVAYPGAYSTTLESAPAQFSLEMQDALEPLGYINPALGHNIAYMAQEIYYWEVFSNASSLLTDQT
jgi:hypothetical protein